MCELGGPGGHGYGSAWGSGQPDDDGRRKLVPGAVSRPGAGGLVLLLTPEPDGEATGPYNGEYAGPQRHLEAADREVYLEEQAQRVKERDNGQEERSEVRSPLIGNTLLTPDG